MSNTNRDYVIVYDVKNSSLILNRPLVFYITDKNTSNIFVRLVTKINIGDGVDQYTDIEDASSYIVLMRTIKPNDEVINIKATQREPESIFEFDLTEEFKNIPGTYICELMISTMVNGRQELITSDSFTYEVKRSILSKIDQIIEHEETTVEKLLNELDAAEAKLFNDLESAKTNLHNDLESTKSELSSQVQSNDNKIENIKGELSSQIKDITKKININILDYFTVGETTWDNAIKKAISQNENKVIEFPDGNYLITEPILINNDNSFILQQNARIYSNRELPYLIHYNTKRTVTEISHLSKDKFIRGGILDCNNVVQNALCLSNYLHFTLEDVKFKNVVKVGLTTRYEGSLSAELIAKNLHFENKIVHQESVAILNNGSDNHFSDIITIDFKTGFKNNSFVIGSRIHPWIFNQELIPNSKAFDLEGIAIFDSLYADTYQYGFYLSNGCTLHLTNSDCYINTSVYTEDLQSSNPVNVFFDNGGSFIKSKHFIFVNNLQESTFINHYDSERYNFEDTFVISSKSDAIVNGLQDKKYANAVNDFFEKVYKTNGFALMNGDNLKGYLATGGADVGLVNSTSNKSLQNRDDGTLTFDNKKIMLINNTKTTNPSVGEYYFDQKRGIPLFWNGLGWVKADGNLPT